MIEVGKKYNERNLRYMRQFYEMIEETKWNTMRSKLSWSHYREVLKITDINEIIFYLNEASNKNLTQRQLQEIIKLKTYSRVSLKITNNIIDLNQVEVRDLIPNPIIIKNKNNNVDLSEYALKELIINDLDNFLLQLGYGFTYVGNEFRIKIGERYNYIDLLLFNIKYNAYVVVELKVTEFKVEYISQVQKYINYIDKNIKEITNNNTIGIIICKKENKFIIEYCSDDRIAVREYELI